MRDETLFSGMTAVAGQFCARARRTCVGVSVALVLTSAFGSAHAQDAVGSVDSLIRLGLQSLQLMDQGKSNDIWERASPVLKAVMSKEALAAKSSQVTQALGGVRARDWSTIDRVRIPEGVPNTPAGFYVNVRYLVQGSNGSTVLELVSFRLESDNNWRLTGYTPR